MKNVNVVPWNMLVLATTRRLTKLAAPLLLQYIIHNASSNMNTGFVGHLRDPVLLSRWAASLRHAMPEPKKQLLLVTSTNMHPTDPIPQPPHLPTHHQQTICLQHDPGHQPGHGYRLLDHRWHGLCSRNAVWAGLWGQELPSHT